MILIQFIHPTIDRYLNYCCLGQLQILLLKTFLQVSFGAHVYMFPLDLYLRVELLGYRICIRSALAGTVKLFS